MLSFSHKRIPFRNQESFTENEAKFSRIEYFLTHIESQ